LAKVKIAKVFESFTHIF